MTRKRILTIIGIVVGVLVLVVYIGGSAYFASSMMPVPRIPLDKSVAPTDLEYEDVSFTSRTDNIMLKGWYMPGENEFAIIIVNGGDQNRIDASVGTPGICNDLVDRGYGVLVFDIRGRGESEGEGLFLTDVEHDIGGAVDFLKNKGYSAGTIGILGFSLGAISSIIFCSEESIAGLVSDSSFAYVPEAFVRKIPKQFGIPKFVVQIINPGAFMMARLIYGYKLRNPAEMVADVKCPVLFIQGDKDDLVRTDDTHELLEASGNPSDEIWILSNVGHTQAYKADPIAYIDKITTFFDRCFEGQP